MEPMGTTALYLKQLVTLTQKCLSSREGPRTQIVRRVSGPKILAPKGCGTLEPYYLSTWTLRVLN